MKAAAIAAGTANPARPARAAGGAAGRPQGTVTIFEYVGQGTALFRGEVSGQVYSFARPGDRVRVDPRDRGSLMKMAQLRWIR